MGRKIRVESADYPFLLTTRTRNSELWLVNNPALELQILGKLAKYQETHAVSLYAFCLQGDHYHGAATFSQLNRAGFMRDLNASIARAVQRYVPTYPGGSLWAREYSDEPLPNTEDLEEYFFYCALQPVRAGLCERISEYPGYNSFFDAISGRERKFKVVDWAAYNARKRYDKKSTVKEFTRTHTLSYKRLPGYEHLSQEEYKGLMLKKLEQRRLALVAARRKAGKGFAGRKALLKTAPGSRPKHTKTSTRTSFRPLVLTKCLETKRRFLEWYFAVVRAYKEASRRFRNGELDTPFPPGTFRPPLFVAP